MLAAQEFTEVENFGRGRRAAETIPAPMYCLSHISPQHIHRRTNEDFDFAADACCAQIHSWGQVGG
jgi:hypothetical protein